jgi:hypothetical protein
MTHKTMMKIRKPHRRSVGFHLLIGAVALGGTLIVTPATTEAAGNATQPTICARSCWNARQAVYRDNMPSLNRAIIHHTAGTYMGTSLSNSKAHMRSIQNYHMDNNGWADIGYGFVVDALGHTFEGMRDSVSRIPRGIHDGVNDRSMGFCVMGYFHSPHNQNPSAAARSALYDVIAWKMPNGWVGPYGSGTYNSRTVGWVDGHRNSRGTTSCPGDRLFAYVTNNYSSGEARNEIDKRIKGSAPPPAPPPGRIDVIVRGQSNKLYWRYFDGYGWRSWFDLGQDARSNPAVASQRENSLDVFFRGPNNDLRQIWYRDGNWNGPASLGGTLTGGAGATSWSDGRLDVVVLGPAGQVQWRHWRSAHGWGPFIDLGVVATSQPSIASWAPGRLDVFYRNTDGYVGHVWSERYESTDWFGPASRGGPVDGAPAVVAWGGGERRLDLAIYQAANNRILWRAWRPDSGGWTSWENTGMHSTSAPAIASWGRGRLDIFFRASTNELYHTGSNRFESSAWHGPYNRGNTLTTGPGAVGGEVW